MAMLNTEEAVTHQAFADLVGKSRQAITDMVGRGILPKRGTLGEWLIAHSDHLTEVAAGRRGDTARTRAPVTDRNPIDVITTTLLPYMFFLLDDTYCEGLETVTETLRAAGLPDDQVLPVLRALADRYGRVIDAHMGCCDGPVNLPEALR